MNFTYYVPPSTSAIRREIQLGTFGMITTPKQGNVIIGNARWVADNGCFGHGYPGDAQWLRWLASRQADRALCAFATAPDVVGDATATLARSAPHLLAIRKLGYPAALVAQDGLERISIPWGTFDVLFIGGTTAWKLSGHARDIAGEAAGRGLGVHMGRVNSLKRMRYARQAGCISADGTYLTYGPDVLLPKAIGWIHQIRSESLL